jgi:hypothetical protein
VEEPSLQQTALVGMQLCSQVACPSELHVWRAWSAFGASRGLSDIGWRATRAFGRSRGLDWMARLRGARKRTAKRGLYIMLTGVNS